MKTKRAAAFLAALILAFSIATGTFAAAGGTDWPQFLGSPISSGLSAAKSPVNAAAAKLVWSQKHTVKSEFNGATFENNACGTPITVGEYLYFTVSDGRLMKLDAATGKAVASAECKNVPLYFSQIAYGGGKIYVPQQTSAGVQISAFDAASLAPVWQSDAITYGETAQQIASPVTYYDGRIYFGTYAQDSKTYAYVSGVYACIDAASGKAVWQQQNSTAGYYWDGGAVLGSAIAVADTAGNLISYRLTDGVKISGVSAGGPVLSTLCGAQGRLYASVKSGYIYSVKADVDGTMYGSTAVKSAVLGNSISSSPVVYNGRLYVAGGGYGATTPFSVLDAATLKTVYQIKDIQSQSSPLVTIAYASDKNKQQVSIYLTKYGTCNQDGIYTKDSSCVYVVKDCAGQTKASYETLFTPAAAQSCTQSLTASRDGMLYYFNDSGTLYAIGSKPALSSPATGEAPLASVAAVLVLSGAAALLFRKKSDY
jgi:FOG: WD40-like repeat